MTSAINVFAETIKNMNTTMKNYSTKMDTISRRVARIERRLSAMEKSQNWSNNAVHSLCKGDEQVIVAIGSPPSLTAVAHIQ